MPHDQQVSQRPFLQHSVSAHYPRSNNEQQQQQQQQQSFSSQEHPGWPTNIQGGGGGGYGDRTTHVHGVLSGHGEPTFNAGYDPSQPYEGRAMLATGMAGTMLTAAQADHRLGFAEGEGVGYHGSKAGAPKEYRRAG